MVQLTDSVPRIALMSTSASAQVATDSTGVEISSESESFTVVPQIPGGLYSEFKKLGAGWSAIFNLDLSTREQKSGMELIHTSMHER